VLGAAGLLATGTDALARTSRDRSSAKAWTTSSS